MDFVKSKVEEMFKKEGKTGLGKGKTKEWKKLYMFVYIYDR